ncbi:uncharacterized protein BX663DRAFT_520717 [Cokeromyces recurvatus]|uniref:uncharacterized protein n=1 Tax=Cokeromyces recurvatus TaxID=90255 RepID=UPI00221FED26|nr:uncharacterized protein BX663DRAFT_520717 [Cokeromyces recurvatus]KAI7899613.1 hypothetical protein BX663DRAFT_520717 [Cokeromyces recurvatus]
MITKYGMLKCIYLLYSLIVVISFEYMTVYCHNMNSYFITIVLFNNNVYRLPFLFYFIFTFFLLNILTVSYCR